MKRILLIGGLLIAFAPGAMAQVVNFHYAVNYAAGVNAGYASIVYSGQGAYSDPGNNIWNGFGGGFNAQTGPNVSSSGAATGVTLSTVYGGANGGLYFNGPDGVGGNTHQGTPFFLLGYNALVSDRKDENGAGTTTTPFGTFTLSGVAQGTYSLFLYGVNYDGDRGSQFTVSSGTAHNGTASTTPTGHSSLDSFAEGVNYVEFDNVTPDASGNITGTWAYNPLAPNTSALEGPFNGLQLVANAAVVPEPGTMTLLGLGLGGLLFFRRRK